MYWSHELSLIRLPYDLFIYSFIYLFNCFLSEGKYKKKNCVVFNELLLLGYRIVVVTKVIINIFLVVPVLTVNLRRSVTFFNSGEVYSVLHWSFMKIIKDLQSFKKCTLHNSPYKVREG